MDKNLNQELLEVLQQISESLRIIAECASSHRDGGRYFLTREHKRPGER